MIEKRKFSKYQMKISFEYFNDLYMKPGKKPAFSAFVFENRERLAGAYVALQNEIYDENRDPQYQEYRRRLAEIQAKWSDKDATGKPKLDENQQFVITEHREKVVEEGSKLNEEFKDLVARVQNKGQLNDQIMNQLIDLDVAVLTTSEFIDECPPFIVGMFRHSGV